MRLWHDLPISVNDRVISPFREDFIFTKLRILFRENKTLAKISELTVLDPVLYDGLVYINYGVSEVGYCFKTMTYTF